MEDASQVRYSPRGVVRANSRRGEAAARNAGEADSAFPSSGRLSDYDVFDTTVEPVKEPSGLLTVSLDSLNDKLWWSGLRFGVVRTHDSTMLAVSWDGPQIWKRFREWKRDG